MHRTSIRALIAACIATVTLATTVAADGLPAPTHAGDTGIHALLDGTETRSVICRYGGAGNTLDAIGIEPPIVFAGDRTAGLDQAVVGWRWTVMGDTGSGFEIARQGPLVKRTASDAQAAPFRRADADVADLSYIGYRIRHTISWYKPGSSTKKVGGSVHWSARYRLEAADLPLGIDVCYPDAPPSIPFTTPPAHVGGYGVHALVDTAEAPGLACGYSYRGIQPLIRVGAGAAIAFAPDRTARVDRGTVIRRLVLQSADDVVSGPWTDRQTLAAERRSATDRRMATFPRRTIALETPGALHAGWRVIARFRFRSPGGAELGRATDLPAWSYEDGGKGFPYEDGACSGSD